MYPAQSRRLELDAQAGLSERQSRGVVVAATSAGGTGRAPSRLDRFGERRHELTAADSRKGGVARWAAERERRDELEQRAVELLAAERLHAIDVWIQVMRDEEARPRFDLPLLTVSWSASWARLGRSCRCRTRNVVT
jgi:hypothetical protein